MLSSRVLMRLVSVFALGSVFAVSVLAATPAKGKSTTPAKKHPHRRPYVRPGETKPAVPSQPSGSGVEVINGANVSTQYFPTQSQGNASQTRVEVINGNVHRTLVFDAEATANTTKPVQPGKLVKFKGVNGGPAMSVRVINGNQWETRAFAAAPEKAGNSAAVEQVRHEPVVVGISSSASENAENNRAPVVVGVASSESLNEPGKSEPVVVQVTSNGSDSGHAVEKPVVTDVSPAQPKRPPYRGSGNQQ